MSLSDTHAPESQIRTASKWFLEVENGFGGSSGFNDVANRDHLPSFSAQFVDVPCQFRIWCLAYHICQCKVLPRFGLLLCFIAICTLSQYLHCNYCAKNNYNSWEQYSRFAVICVLHFLPPLFAYFFGSNVMLSDNMVLNRKQIGKATKFVPDVCDSRKVLLLL